jgi:hypothetical protein
MGRGHSGTRLVAWALTRLGVRMGALPEKPTGDVQDRRFTRAIKALALRALDRPPAAPPPSRDLGRFQRAVRRYRRWLPGEETPWGWKFPETYLIGPLVAACFPQARYVHLLRDGRDVALKSHLTDDPRRRLGRKVLRACSALDAPPHVRAARSWALQVGRFRAFARTLPPAQVLEVRFERLCEKPVAVLEELAAFAGLSPDDARRAWLSAAVNPDKVGEHGTMEPERLAEVEGEIGEALRDLGYTG